MLERVARFLLEHPEPTRDDVRRLGDVVRRAEEAVKRGVGVSAETWVSLCLDYAERGAERGANGWVWLLWALTKASGPDQLGPRVGPDLHAIVARAAAAGTSTKAPAPFAEDLEKQRQKQREKLRRELEEKRKRG